MKDSSLYNKFSNLRLYLTGFAMGGADLIPGVSGGTIAFILGVYEALLSAIKSVNVNFLKSLCNLKFKEALSMIPLRFLIFLGAGIGTAIIGMANTMSYLLENERVFLFSFFFGLIIASIITIGKTIKWNLRTFISLILGTLAGFTIVGLVPSEMPHEPLYIFFSGMVAIMAMILPGISGSFILLILGQYSFILEAVKKFDLLTIVPFAFGAVIGITGFSRILSWLLQRHNAITIAALVGFMIGSLRKVWPWKETLETLTDHHGKIIPIREANILPLFNSNEFVISVILAIVAICLLFFINRLANKSN